MNKLEVRGVSKRFADKQVLEDISIRCLTTIPL